MPCQKNVSFDKIVRIQSVPSVDDFSQLEREAVWFSNEDMLRMRSRERKMKKEMSLNDILRIEIGLESKLDRHRRQLRVKNGIYSVLAEQSRQWDDRSHDPEMLARSSSETSQESTNLAVKNARSVEKQLLNFRCQPSYPNRSTMRSISAPFSTSTSANQRWHVDKYDEGPPPPPRRPERKGLKTMKSFWK